MLCARWLRFVRRHWFERRAKRFLVLFNDLLTVLLLLLLLPFIGWLGSRVVSVLDSGAAGPGNKSQPRRYRVTVLGKLFTLIVPLFTKQRN